MFPSIRKRAPFRFSTRGVRWGQAERHEWQEGRAGRCRDLLSRLKGSFSWCFCVVQYLGCLHAPATPFVSAVLSQLARSCRAYFPRSRLVCEMARPGRARVALFVDCACVSAFSHNLPTNEQSQRVCVTPTSQQLLGAGPGKLTRRTMQ